MQLERPGRSHDPLTKLPNRLLLLDRAKQAIARLTAATGVVAMLFIDLDKFKAVNDTLGHEVGDELLVAISDRLAELMRDTDTVARLGGDEFVILAVDLESEAEALALGERVVEAIEQPVALASTEVPMAGSVGISVAIDPATDPETMLREADVAMYRAKAAGGQPPEVFDEQHAHRAEHEHPDRGPAAQRPPPGRAHAAVPADPPPGRRSGDRLRGPDPLARPRSRASSTTRSCCPPPSFRPPRRAS